MMMDIIIESNARHMAFNISTCLERRGMAWLPISLPAINY